MAASHIACHQPNTQPLVAHRDNERRPHSVRNEAPQRRFYMWYANRVQHTYKNNDRATGSRWADGQHSIRAFVGVQDHADHKHTFKTDDDFLPNILSHRHKSTMSRVHDHGSHRSHDHGPATDANSAGSHFTRSYAPTNHNGYHFTPESNSGDPVWIELMVINDKGRARMMQQAGYSTASSTIHRPITRLWRKLLTLAARRNSSWNDQYMLLFCPPPGPD